MNVPEARYMLKGVLMTDDAALYLADTPTPVPIAVRCTCCDRLLAEWFGDTLVMKPKERMIRVTGGQVTIICERCGTCVHPTQLDTITLTA